MPVSKRLRYEILRRDNHTCRYCGAAAPNVTLTVDHVMPLSLGGTDDPTNLVTACSACNAGKAASNPDAPLVADVAQAALKWQQAIQLATELALRDRERLDPVVEDVIAYWLDQWSGMSHDARPYPDPDARASVREWAARGLTAAEMRELIDVTYAKWLRDRHLKDETTWRYFAGCCRNKLADIEARARAAIDNGEI